MRGLCMGAVFALVVSTAGQAQYHSPEHDLRAALRVEMLAEGVRYFSGTRYRSEYQNNGTICTSPKITFDLRTVEVGSNAFVNLVDGRSGANISLRIAPQFLVEECGKWSFEPHCAAGTALLTLSSDIPVDGYCRLVIVTSSFVWPIHTTIKHPVNIPASFPVTLTSPVETESLALNLEFGVFRNEAWVPASSPTRVVQVRIDSGGMAGQNIIDPQRPTLGFSSSNPILLFDATVGTPHVKPAPSAEQAFQAYMQDAPLEPGEPFGFSISPSFFGRGSDTVTGNGFFGSILPIRVHGFQRIGKQRIGFDLYLTDASVRFAEVKGAPVMLVEFGVGKASLFDRDIIGKTYPIKKIAANALIRAPEIDASGKVKLKFDELMISLQGDGGSTAACLCVRTGNIGSSLGEELPIIRIESEIVLELPECIELGNVRFEARDQNWQGYRCKSLGNTWVSKAANLDQTKRTTIRITSGGVKPRLKDGRIQWAIPKENVAVILGSH